MKRIYCKKVTEECYETRETFGEITDPLFYEIPRQKTAEEIYRWDEKLNTIVIDIPEHNPKEDELKKQVYIEALIREKYTINDEFKEHRKAINNIGTEYVAYNEYVLKCIEEGNNWITQEIVNKNITQYPIYKEPESGIDARTS